MFYIYLLLNEFRAHKWFVLTIQIADFRTLNLLEVSNFNSLKPGKDKYILYKISFILIKPRSDRILDQSHKLFFFLAFFSKILWSVVFSYWFSKISKQST